MGGIGTAITAGTMLAGSTAVNLLNDRKQAKKTKKDMFANYQQNTRKRRNLLEEQLATRRAKLGASGLVSSPSALAAQNREINQAYEDIDYDADKYQRDVRQTERNYRAGMYSTLLSGGANRIIK